MLIVRRKAPVSGVFLFLYPWMSVYGEELMFLVWVLCLFVWAVSALFVDASCSIAYFFGLVLFCSGWFSWVLFCLFFLIFLKCAFHGSTFRLAGDCLASSGQKSSTRRQGEPGSWGIEFEPDWGNWDEETRLEEDTVIDFESCAKLRCDLAPQDPLPNLPRYRTKDEAPFEMGARVQSSLRYNRLAHLVVPSWG